MNALIGGNSDGFIDHPEFVTNQTNTFTKQYPNMYPTGENYNIQNNTTLANAGLGLKSWDPNTRQSTSRDIDIARYATSVQVSQQLIDANQKCVVAPIDSLINTINTKDKVRCGWLYTKGDPGDQPKLSQGFLGTKNGPLNFLPTQPPSGTWYWNLDDAKQKILADRCGALTSCTNVGAANYASCAFSTSRGIGIPVNEKGSVLYPRVDALNAPRSSLITNSSQCPPPPGPGSPAYELARSRDVCTPLEDGSLSRDCMLQQINVAGCSKDGSLYDYLLNQAMPNNYAAGLQNTLSYKKYQQLASNPLLTSVLTSGNTTTQIALGNFKDLANAASKVDTTALNYASRDLCLQKGLMDTFDFCSELLPSSPGPFSLDCLQKAWGRAGVLPAGTGYPTSSTLSNYQSKYTTWKDYLTYVNNLAATCKSSDEPSQRAALKQFMGVQREPILDQIDPIFGIEVFWFDRGTNTFLGRRVNSADPKFPTFSTDDIIENTGKNSMIEYYALTNIRPPSDISMYLSMESDDGIAYVLNTTIDGKATRTGTLIDTYSNEKATFAANWDQAPTSYKSSNCWKLKQGGPNYISGFWQQTYGFSHSKILWSPCDGTAAPKPFPAEWMTLTQEPDAPMFSWEGKIVNDTMTFTDRRFPSVMELWKAGAATMIKNTNSAFKYPILLQLKSSGNGQAVVTRVLAINSWRTLTLSFLAGNSNESILLQFGALKINLTGNNVLFSWQSATFQVTATFQNAIDISESKPNYIIVNMRSQYRNMYPNTISFYAGTYGSYSSDKLQTFTTTNNNPLYNTSDKDYLILGDRDQVKSANVKIASLRLFDYELKDEQFAIDQANTWKMKYII